MHTNRIRQTRESVARTASQAVQQHSVAFTACPACLMQGPWQQEVYRQAYEQALASTRSVFLERVHAVIWN